MVATTTRTCKPRATVAAARVTVRPVDVRAGLYATLSSDGATWYTTDVAAVTCTCKAGQDGFARCKQMPYCRHMLAAKLVARALARMSAADRAAALRVTTAVHVKVGAILARMAATRTAGTAAPLAAAA